MSKDIETPMIELIDALADQMVYIKHIKVDRLPVVDGKEIESLFGVQFKTVIKESDAEVWEVAANDE